jgi:TolB protein
MADGDSFSGDPAYSADGSEVVYMSNEDGHWHIYLMNADGTNVRRLTEGDADYLFPVWRPVAGGP